MTGVVRGRGGAATATTRGLVTLLRTIVVLLSLEFVLGIWVNLFGSFPSTRDLGTAWAYAGDPVLTAHYVLAVLLLVLGAVIVTVAVRTGARAGLRWMAVLGLLSIAWASAAGMEFVRSGFTNNEDSFSMALAFIVASSFYGVAQALVPPHTPPHRPPPREEGG